MTSLLRTTVGFEEQQQNVKHLYITGSDSKKIEFPDDLLLETLNVSDCPNVSRLKASAKKVIVKNCMWIHTIDCRNEAVEEIELSVLKRLGVLQLGENVKSLIVRDTELWFPISCNHVLDTYSFNFKCQNPDPPLSIISTTAKNMCIHTEGDVKFETINWKHVESMILNYPCINYDLQWIQEVQTLCFGSYRDSVEADSEGHTRWKKKVCRFASERSKSKKTTLFSISGDGSLKIDGNEKCILQELLDRYDLASFFGSLVRKGNQLSEFACLYFPNEEFEFCFYDGITGVVLYAILTRNHLPLDTLPTYSRDKNYILHDPRCVSNDNPEVPSLVIMWCEDDMYCCFRIYLKTYLVQ